MLAIFSLLPTTTLLPLTPTCHHFHTLITRLIHYRLQIAAGLDANTLYLECHHPSARLTASKFFCTSLGTDGFDELLGDINDDSRYIGVVQRMGTLFSRFRPQRSEPLVPPTGRHPAGDIPGSRTYGGASSSMEPLAEDEVVYETVTVDAHDLFSQLTTLAYLGKRERTRGLLFSIQEVCEGTIRVWRDWLSKQCESKSWTDGETVIVHHDAPSSPSAVKGKARAHSVNGYEDPTKHPSILWINTRDESVGIKFRVKERKLRRANPILYTSDVEVAVSYEVEFEGVTRQFVVDDYH